MLPAPEQCDWFWVNVHPHLDMLRAWLHSRFSPGCDADDIVQETCVRVLRARDTGAIESPKAFLFAIARNLAVNRLRHQAIENKYSMEESDDWSILEAEDADVRKEVAHAEELEILTQAIQSLPPRCRRILTMRKVYGMAQKAIAAELGIAERTVEAQVTIGLRKISSFFARYDRCYGGRDREPLENAGPRRTH